MLEEFIELLESCYKGKEEQLITNIKNEILDLLENGEQNVDIVELADASIDLDYVIEGMRISCGIDGRPLADIVHEANMKKFAKGCRYRNDGKLLKPLDWKPPDIEGELKKQGWKS